MTTPPPFPTNDSNPGPQGPQFPGPAPQFPNSAPQFPGAFPTDGNANFMPSQQGTPGTFGRRLGAILIDGVILGIIASIIGAIANTFTTTNIDESANSLAEVIESYSVTIDNPAAYYGLLALSSIIGILYWILLEIKGGQTLGKKILKLKVVSFDDSPITPAQVVKRRLWLIIVYAINPFIGIVAGLIWFVCAIVIVATGNGNPLKQSAFDRFANAKVVYNA